MSVGGAGGVQGGENVNLLAGVDTKSMSVEDLMFLVMSKRTELLENQMKGFADEMKDRNQLLSQTNSFLAEARNLAAGLKDGQTAVMSPEMVKFFKDNKINLPGTGTGAGLSKDQKLAKIETILTAVKNKGYTDGACVRKDLPPEAIAAAKELGIELKNNGRGWNSTDWGNFKSAVETRKIEVQGEKPGGTSGGGGTFTSEQWRANIENLKGFTEGLNNQSQTDMIKYQSVMSKYTGSVEMLSNTVKKFADMKSSIVGNIR